MRRRGLFEVCFRPLTLKGQGISHVFCLFSFFFSFLSSSFLFLFFLFCFSVFPFFLFFLLTDLKRSDYMEDNFVCHEDRD